MPSLSKNPAILAVRKGILKFLDFFYPLFRRFLPITTYRYLACGGSATLLSLVAYAFSYNFLLPDQELTHIGTFTLRRYIAAYVIAFLVSFPVGFFLSKFVVFSDSSLKGKIQLFRYGALQVMNIFFNWGLLHLFVGFLGFWPTPSQTLTAVILAIFSYFFQRFVSFKAGPVPVNQAFEEKETLLISTDQ